MDFSGSEYREVFPPCISPENKEALTMQYIKKQKRFLGIKQKDLLFGMILATPALIVLFITIFLPILKGVYVSFCDYKLATLNSPKWNNFKNYAGLFEKGEIMTYFKNTFVFVFFTVTVQFLVGFSLALLLNSGIHGQRVFRGLFLVPPELSQVPLLLQLSPDLRQVPLGLRPGQGVQHRVQVLQVPLGQGDLLV